MQVHADFIPFGKVTGYESFGQQGFQALLQEAPQGPRPVDRIITLPGDPLHGGVRYGEFYLACVQALLQVGQKQSHDLLDFIQGEGLEEKGVIDPVEKLRTEKAAQFGEDGFPHGFGYDSAMDAIHEPMASQVGGHDDDGVLEVHRPPPERR